MTNEENHRQYLNLLIAQDRTFGNIYGQMAKELSYVLKRYKVRANSNVWHKNLQIKKEVDSILSKYRTIIFSQISTASSNAWELSERHNDRLVDQYTNGINLPKKQKQSYYNRNTQALAAFQQRSRDGFNLSDRVWNLTDQTRGQLETFISEGLTDGRSAVSLAGDLKKYLQDPDKRFRRVRNKVTGKLMTSAPGENYHPGRGVYRSSYKNALRLARNEINIAYRTADIERRKNLPFVTGIKVNLSPAHPAYDICDELQGEYPKEFVFTGWHVNCLCFTTSKLLSRKEFVDHLNGKGIPQSKYVKTIPENAARYLNANSDRIKGLTNKPYFIRDNFKNTKDGLDLKKSIGPKEVDWHFPKLEPLNELEAIRQLKDAGITFNYNKENYKLFKDRSPGFDFNIMFQELEGQLLVSGINNVRKSVYLNNNGFDFKLTARDFEMSRRVTYGDVSNSVYHSYLRLPKTAQGNGLTKRMFQSLYKQYEAGNIKRINVTANIDIGGYAWAKYGFSATKRSDVIEIIRRSNNDKWASKALRKVNYHYKRYGNDKPFEMRRLITIKGGKKELLNTLWSGTIDLDNEAQKRRFLEYLLQ